MTSQRTEPIDVECHEPNKFKTGDMWVVGFLLVSYVLFSASLMGGVYLRIKSALDGEAREIYGRSTGEFPTSGDPLEKRGSPSGETRENGR